ncbi:hypothetical protein RhiirA4_477754 [Rhizophagus irregularis]|uniref:Reverse transcriptase domain-containing protein n=1 Tax=Rhizophagus irregularis TaxID=588596 RepID=A0A2I1HDU6_9GLOM|nr:hypothetical protein RhiirA4_477754 [Rhizophagus irregularis]
MRYEIEHCFKSNVQSDQSEKLKINISSQSYMDDVTWITKSKAQLEQILKIADEFNIMNNIQTNYDKFEMITNKKLDKDMIEVNFGSSKRLVKPLISKRLYRNTTRQLTSNKYMFKRKASLPLTIPNSIIHSSMGYAIKDINTIQAQRQLSRVYNQVTAKGIMRDIFEADSRILALLYDNMLTIRSSGIKVNQIEGGSLPIVEIFTHKEIFNKGISKGLKGKNVYFASQLMSSDGMRLLRYKDLKHRIKINTQGRIPSWFKFVENKLIEEPVKSKKVKNNYQLGYSLYNEEMNIDKLKTKNWITTFHNQIGKPIIGRVLDKPKEDQLWVEHWIQELEDDQLSPSVQLPIIKKCGGWQRIVLKLMQIQYRMIVI